MGVIKQVNPNLSDKQKEVLFNKATEAPFSGDLLRNDKNGMYTCANCGAELFSSSAKFESTAPGLTGWPSFSEVANNKAVSLADDDSAGMHRVEVTCANCGAHLGHLFEDAPDHPSGKHYCINSCSLGFMEQKESKK